MTELIAETAWHHEGDFPFMRDLIKQICSESAADIVKMHLTLDLDEYMDTDHEAYSLLSSWMLTPAHWEELIGIVRSHGKRLMLLLNDTEAVKFAARFQPDFVELHSVCLNVPRLQEAILEYIDPAVPVVIGAGGCTLQEVDAAVQNFFWRKIIIMHGFQNYPTRFEDVNLNKIRKISALYHDRQVGYADHTGWNESDNGLITLLVTANGMGYVEKHVTTAYGEERCDWSAAISIPMFNDLARKIKLLDRLDGDGSLRLNSGEKAYSRFGSMKMAAIITTDVPDGATLTRDMFTFKRTGKTSNLGQIEVLEAVNHSVARPLSPGHLLQREDLAE